MKQLRPYQKETIKKTAIALKNNRRVILQSPTGSGKSFMMYSIIQSAIHKGKTILVMSESTKIYKQLVKEFMAIQINADTKFLYVEPNRVYCAMVQSLKNRPKILKQFFDIYEKDNDNLILICDEAHLGNFSRVIDLFKPETVRTGCTATSDYRVAKHLPKLYRALVPGVSVKYLIDEKNLCDYKHIARTKADLSQLVMKNGEFTEDSQDQVFSSSVVYDGLFEDLKNIQYNK